MDIKYYESLNIEQLEDVVHNINQEKFPDRYDMIQQTLQEKIQFRNSCREKEELSHIQGAYSSIHSQSSVVGMAFGTLFFMFVFTLLIIAGFNSFPLSSYLEWIRNIVILLGWGAIAKLAFFINRSMIKTGVETVIIKNDSLEVCYKNQSRQEFFFTEMPAFATNGKGEFHIIPDLTPLKKSSWVSTNHAIIFQLDRFIIEELVYILQMRGKPILQINESASDSPFYVMSTEAIGSDSSPFQLPDSLNDTFMDTSFSEN